MFLDRDGVINRKLAEGSYVRRWADFHLLPGVEVAIASLNRSDIRVIVVSNQRGIALGLYTAADVLAIHAQLQEHLGNYGACIDAFYFCPHDEDECNCRKPKTGLLEQAFHDFPGAAAFNSILIGDSLSDIQAAKRLGMPAIFLMGARHTQKSGADKAANLADYVCASLQAAVDTILE